VAHCCGGFDVERVRGVSHADITSNLVGYWSFNDGTGTVATDFSGNGNTGSVIGAPTWINGKRGTALSFDGNDDYIDVGDPSDGSLDFGTATDFSISAWVKFTDQAKHQRSLGSNP
jgi:hypothetical protein